jgi:hypothetical protein
MNRFESSAWDGWYIIYPCNSRQSGHEQTRLLCTGDQEYQPEAGVFWRCDYDE